MKIYIIENLDCANCAAKIERKINELPGVEDATLTFATKQLRVTAKNPDALLDQMRQVARTVESQATIEPRAERTPAGYQSKVYIIENLDCANCAAKMETAINKIPGVNEATVSFMTQRLVIEADDDRFDEIVKEAAAACRKVDADCQVLI